MLGAAAAEEVEVEMTGRRVAAWGAGAGVVLAGVSAALINELPGGWPWWVAAGAAVLIAASLSAWLAHRAAREAGDQLEGGAVKAGRNIDGNVRTNVSRLNYSRMSRADGDLLGPGAVKAGRDVRGDITTNVSGVRDHRELP